MGTMSFISVVAYKYPVVKNVYSLKLALPVIMTLERSTNLTFPVHSLSYTNTPSSYLYTSNARSSPKFMDKIAYSVLLQRKKSYTRIRSLSVHRRPSRQSAVNASGCRPWKRRKSLLLQPQLHSGKLIYKHPDSRPKGGCLQSEKNP